MTTPVRTDHHGSIAVIVIDHPPVNALSQAVAKALDAAVSAVESDAGVEAVLLHAAGKTFVAGADISDFSSPDFNIDIFHGVFNRLEVLDRPIVAALHGTVLGGGLELALACHYRIAAPAARLGLPEVTLGILPGGGGTQRLPRLIDPAQAFELISSGRQITAETAKEMGLIDEIADGDPLEAGLAYAQRLIDEASPPRPTGRMTVDTSALPEDFFKTAHDEAASRKAAYPAPVRIVRCVEAATRLPLEEGLALEKRMFEECRNSPESKAMRHLFFAEREARKIPGVSKDEKTRSIGRVGVVGAGTMGTGIAMTFLNAGIDTTIVEANPDALESGLAKIRKVYESSMSKGRLSADDLEKRVDLLTGTLDDGELAGCDLVIEAVFEDFGLKKRICARLGEICRPGAIIATNTSTLDVNALAEATGRPADMLGMHFFSPANIMRLLEVVRGAQTASDVLATIMKLAGRVGKVPVVAGVCYGFIGNRLIEPYMREAEFMLMEGASPSQIDEAIQSLGLPMGPCRMLDMAGVDVGALTVIERAKAGGLPPDPAYRAVVQAMKERGWHGQKTGIGYYRYEGRHPYPNPDLEKLCAALAKRFGIVRRNEIPAQEIIERCLYTLMNEGALALEEGIAIRPGDIDVVYVHGYGFPDYRGGPMYMADQIGVTEIVDRLHAYGKRGGNPFGYWTPATLLVDLARQGGRIADWDPSSRS